MLSAAEAAPHSINAKTNVVNRIITCCLIFSPPFTIHLKIQFTCLILFIIINKYTLLILLVLYFDIKVILLFIIINKAQNMQVN